MKKGNYTNRIYGDLTVMECVVASDGSNQGGIWLCKCKCGRSISLSGYSLSHRKSCGCLVRKAAKKRGISLRNPEQKKYTIAYHQYVANCKYKKEQSLSKEEWKEIISKPCIYCNSVGVGYVSEKKSCCKVCYNMKGGMLHQEFLDHIKSIINR